MPSALGLQRVKERSARNKSIKETAHLIREAGLTPSSSIYIPYCLEKIAAAQSSLTMNDAYSSVVEEAQPRVIIGQKIRYPVFNGEAEATTGDVTPSAESSVMRRPPRKIMKVKSKIKKGTSTKTANRKKQALVKKNDVNRVPSSSSTSASAHKGGRVHRTAQSGTESTPAAASTAATASTTSLHKVCPPGTPSTVTSSASVFTASTEIPGISITTKTPPRSRVTRQTTNLKKTSTTTKMKTITDEIVALDTASEEMMDNDKHDGKEQGDNKTSTSTTATSSMNKGGARKVLVMKRVKTRSTRAKSRSASTGEGGAGSESAVTTKEQTSGQRAVDGSKPGAADGTEPMKKKAHARSVASSKLPMKERILQKYKESNTLKLSLNWLPFWLIASGHKRNEYRACSTFIEQRLFVDAKTQSGSRRYDYVEFLNGRDSSRPWLRVEFRGFEKRKLHEGFSYPEAPEVHLDAGEYYVISLGSVVESRNLPKDMQDPTKAPVKSPTGEP